MRPIMENKVGIPIIYICSPYRPTSEDEEARAIELEANVKRASDACRLLVKLGYMPLAPHLYFPRFLDDNDPKERKEGMSLGMEWLEYASELWVFGSYISEGMAEEIAFAKRLGIPVRCIAEPSEVIQMLLDALEKKNTGESI